MLTKVCILICELCYALYVHFIFMFVVRSCSGVVNKPLCGIRQSTDIMQISIGRRKMLYKSVLLKHV